MARIVFHLTCYEQRIALPWMRLWFGDDAPPRTDQTEDAQREEADWNGGQGHPLADMLADLRAVRAAQIALIADLPDDAWQRELPALWGPVSLHWLVTKTLQHTLEHTDEILRQYLWWR